MPGAATKKRGKPAPSHADYVKAFKLVGTVIANPNLPKDLSKVHTAERYNALQTRFIADGRTWMKPATAPAAKPATAKAAKAASTSPAG